ncbi:uncharacterized protein LOC112538797 isoform X2 [Tetranychus urticae]|uniref:uncharacterized protein LOC112538797 isoform X2 n=1 Tax=Tetranychus urticae TaxID=32264 RepID=UPI000D656ACE|nr:uncharacterized protein LOC112538797 isoform X2 [Tetranychus urticae]
MTNLREPKYQSGFLILSYDNLDVDFITTLTVKGLVLTSYCKGLENVTFHNPSLEMLVISHICSFFANEIQGPIMKQLNIGSCNVSDFARCAKYFPNLKRLHIEEYTDYTSDNFYTGPVLEKLEILEMVFHAQIAPGEYHGFSLADQKSHKSIVENTFDIPSVEMIAAPDYCNFFANDIQGTKLKQYIFIGA